MKFKGVDTISDAEKLAGAEVAIPFEQRAELSDDEVYQSDLDRLRSNRRHRARRSEWWPISRKPAATPLLRVGENLLIPFAQSICTKIDLEHKQITVNLPEGLLDLN